jgi:hypothetical protein
MPGSDSEFWKEAAQWLAGLLVVPIVYVWKKVNSTVQKEDFKEFCARFDQHCRDDREVQSKLFDKIDDLKTTMLERLPK